jgi:hypothetical protein
MLASDFATCAMKPLDPRRAALGGKHLILLVSSPTSEPLGGWKSVSRNQSF